jgi:hypothetical protein
MITPCGENERERTMEPVISPWVFYILGILGTLKEVSIIFFVASLLATLIIGAAWIVHDNSSYDCDRGKAPAFFKYAKLALVFLLVSLPVFIGTPSVSTAYKMLIASQVTVDRVEKGSQAIDKIYNDILKRVDKALDKKD